MKKLLLSLLTIAVVSAVGVGATRAYFSDTETSTGNTFAAGTLDLEVNGTNAMVPFVVSDMKPGDTTGSPTYQICNVGSLPGVVTMEVNNVTTNENTVINPEEDAADAVDTRLDPDGFTIASSGYGELLDQVLMIFWVDDTPGQRPAPFDWQDTKWEGYPDESAHYSLPVGTDLLDGKNFTLQPAACGYVGVVTKFIDDTNTPYQWILDGVANNAAMGDDIMFDLTVGLKQL